VGISKTEYDNIGDTIDGYIKYEEDIYKGTDIDVDVDIDCHSNYLSLAVLALLFILF